MNIGKFVWFVFCVLIILGVIVMATMIIIDSPTVKDIGTEMVPCIDEKGNPFKDELCENTITCSWLGFMEDKKCSEIGNLNQRSKE